MMKLDIRTEEHGGPVIGQQNGNLTPIDTRSPTSARERLRKAKNLFERFIEARTRMDAELDVLRVNLDRKQGEDDLMHMYFENFIFPKHDVVIQQRSKQATELRLKLGKIDIKVLQLISVEKMAVLNNIANEILGMAENKG